MDDVWLCDVNVESRRRPLAAESRQKRSEKLRIQKKMVSFCHVAAVTFCLGYVQRRGWEISFLHLSFSILNKKCYSRILPPSAIMQSKDSVGVRKHLFFFVVVVGERFGSVDANGLRGK